MLVAACGGDEPGATAPTPTQLPTGVTAEVLDNEFKPARVVIATGGTVRWNYTGPIGLHTMTESNALFDSHPDCPAKPAACMKAKGDTFSHTFAGAGTFTYSCKVHGEIMSGTVIVRG
ncbi:MAG: plastocyanin/azurin family copper-binding protein [Actinomycetota bacterium]